MARHTFNCIDGHTCGNPVRVVRDGGPDLDGATMAAKRLQFIADHDWIRTGLMFEPRGHDLMSGSILYPSTRPDCDVGVLFIETSGCLPMCGHGAMGTVTIAVEQGLVTPAQPGLMRLDTPAGVVEAHYTMDGDYVAEVRLTNVPSFLFASGLAVTCPGLGDLTVDVAYGGNFYAIVDPQPAFRDIADYTAGQLVGFSQDLRAAINARHTFQHPTQPDITGLRHILWAGAPSRPEATARNAVFYGERAIDRSPCGTGTSARMAQWVAQGRLAIGQPFVHESIIGSVFHGRAEAAAQVGDVAAIIPSVAGWAQVTGHNTIIIDDRDPFAHGFTV